MGMQLERYYAAMEEQYAADHPVASRWGTTPSDLVVISPEIERRKLLDRLAPPQWLRELSWNTLPVVLGGVITAGVIALIALFWRHVI
jgi:hypothetical protein